MRRLFNVGMGGDPATERAVLERNYPGLEGTLGDALLVPHRPYLSDLRPVLPHLRGIAHVTGGGIPGNLPRILPDGLGARLDRQSWRVPALFRLIQETGGLDEADLLRAFNAGVGVIVAVAPEDAAGVSQQLSESWVIGEVTRGDGVDWR